MGNNFEQVCRSGNIGQSLHPNPPEGHDGYCYTCDNTRYLDLDKHGILETIENEKHEYRVRHGKNASICYLITRMHQLKHRGLECPDCNDRRRI